MDSMIRDWFLNPPIHFRAIGSSGVADGPIIMAGFYIDPYCHPECCRPYGPFDTAEEALTYSRLRLACDDASS